jgi:hypothetical protein
VTCLAGWLRGWLWGGDALYAIVLIAVSALFTKAQRVFGLKNVSKCLLMTCCY